MSLPFDQAGEGPAVVLLHAGVADRTMWAEHLQPLAREGFRVLAFDLPGFGEAGVTPGEQAPWLDVLQAMDAAGIERAALVGNSYGGAVALRVAAVAPERVWALVLVSTPAPGLEPSEELEAAWELEEAALERGDLDAAVAAVADTWAQPGPVRERVAEMQRRAFAVQADADVSEAPDPVEDLAALEQLDVPALVTAGELDMSDFLEGARRLAEALPSARHVVIEGAGHLAPLEAPDAFRELVLAELRPRAAELA
ncbi:MAG TPA: alpha/beta hydrolase [Solirubrobacteraceae bacterium]|nr:alpha/beta hydrolase [Solirubrobacteraceae bacterium]